jgi:aminomethyltransferase
MANLRTPLYDWHVAHKARMVPFGGWDMPVQYTSIIEEHKAVRTSCGLFDISHMGRLVFEGAGALDAIQRVFTNDAATMKPGQVRYGLVCNEQGGILDDVLVYRLPEYWLMVVNASNRTKIVAWIQEHLGRSAVTLTDRTFDWAMIALQGPRAVEANQDASRLKYYFAAVTDIPDRDGTQIISRTGYTGEDGYEAIVPKEYVEELVFILTEKQTAWRFDFPVLPCGLGARDTLRLEASMPLYGHELSENIDPFQAGLGWAVKLDKGDFIGRKALQQLTPGVPGDAARPRRIGLELEGRRAAREGCPVLAGGKTVGTVTSGSFAPTLEKSIAMAYVSPEFATPGTALTVDIRGAESAARVVPLPFYKRAK